MNDKKLVLILYFMILAPLLTCIISKGTIYITSYKTDSNKTHDTATDNTITYPANNQKNNDHLTSDNNNDTIIITFIADADKKESNYIYHDYLSISTDDPNLLFSNWIPSKEPVDCYDTLLKKNKKTYIKPFSITLQATRLDQTIPYNDKANIHIIYYKKSDNQINHEYMPFSCFQKSHDIQTEYTQSKLPSKTILPTTQPLDTQSLDTQSLQVRTNVPLNTEQSLRLNQKNLDNTYNNRDIYTFYKYLYYYIKQITNTVQNFYQNYLDDYYLPYYLQWLFTANILLYFGIRQLKKLKNQYPVQTYAIAKTIISMIMIAGSIFCTALALKFWFIINQKIILATVAF